MENMCNLLNLLLLYLVYSNQRSQGLTVRKFVYQKDMSEHCRRRVVPSVFLGRHVMEAHSQILHFSRMELPYSCFISVRAEAGNSIVLVVQLLSEDSMINACTESNHQLLVYEMGETFGGYWGPFPDSMLTQKPTTANYYTRRTTAPPTTRDRQIEKLNDSLDKTTTVATTAKKEVREEDFIRVEVPIVEASGVLVDADEAPKRVAFDPDRVFDMLYDVTPRAGSEYRTKMLPVVQFSIRRRMQDGRRAEDPRFDLDYDAPIYTTDSRLTIPRYADKTTKKQNAAKTNFYVKKLFNYDYTRSTHTTESELFSYKTNFSTKDITLKSLLDETSPSTKNRYIKIWKNIEKMLRNKTESVLNLKIAHDENKNASSILEGVSNMKHNKSVYLEPDWSSLVDRDKMSHYVNVTQHFKSFTRTPLRLVNFASKKLHQFRKTTVSPAFLIKDVRTESSSVIGKKKNNTKSKVSEDTQSYNTSNNKNNTTSSLHSVSSTLLPKISRDGNRKMIEAYQESLLTSELSQATRIEHITSHDVTTRKAAAKVASSSETNVLLTGSMVGHESWENVVQAAPVMAVLLNKTVNNYDSDNTPLQDIHWKSATISSEKVRSKRYIEPIPIENARPYHRSTRYFHTDTTRTTVHKMGDMQDFAQLVEIQDDELHDRIALRYLRQYAGPALFNLCGNSEPKSRHVYLFNSSRIVIALTNFTLDRMTVMLTPARSLLAGEIRCAPASLECQVYGTRICIDSMNACDGVPNCGAYDIYDEDRMMCGAAGGLQHNVYLAAVTFLALLLTLMYMVHYWLKRCVPKVSEAFFIYTDGAENVLYLETIMRSPHDVEEYTSKGMYGHLSSDDYLNYTNKIHKQRRKNCIHRLLIACFLCCKCNRKKKTLQHAVVDDFCRQIGPRDIGSFAELELNKMLYSYQVPKSDVAIQTGQSLEMPVMNFKAKSTYSLTHKDSIYKYRNRPQNPQVQERDVTMNTDLHANDELSLLKFFKVARADPVPSSSHVLTSHDMPGSPSRHRLSSNDEEELRTHMYESQHSCPIKHDVGIQIATTSGVHVEKPHSSKPTPKRLRFDDEPTAIPCEEENEDDIQQPSIESEKTEEPTLPLGRDFKRFWKNKKGKKKTQLSIR